MSDCESDAGRGDVTRDAETLSTEVVTSADEFVWIDSHNRLVEVQQLPWTSEDLARVVRAAGSGGLEALPRLSYYLQVLPCLVILLVISFLQRVLVRVSREAQRLSSRAGKCSRHEVMSCILGSVLTAVSWFCPVLFLTVLHRLCPL